MVGKVMVVRLPLSVLGEDYLIFHGDDADPNIWVNYLSAFTEFHCNTIRLAFSSTNASYSCSRYNQAKMNTVLNHLNSVGVKAVLADCAGAGSWYGSQEWVNDWVVLANTYKNDPRVVALQPINEPYPDFFSSTGPTGGIHDQESMIIAMAYLIDRIREVDSSRTIIFPLTVGVLEDNWNDWDGFYSSLQSHRVLTKGNIIFDVIHPYYMEGSWDGGMTPVQKADWYRDTYLLPAINLFGASKVWCGETFGFPSWQSPQGTPGDYDHQLDFELQMIKHLVDNGVGFQMMWYFTFYYFNDVQLEHDILVQSAYMGGTVVVPPVEVPTYFTCSVCGAVFDSQVELDVHVTAVHQVELDIPVVAPAGSPMWVATECGLDQVSVDRLRVLGHKFLPEEVIEVYHSDGECIAEFLRGHPVSKKFVKEKLELFLDLFGKLVEEDT